ncbi:biotin--[acetyl-CoA-carboxylase] ligase [Maribacter halichondriae]|uniref:biotin--[acetyl-CoA-carboxylase] ligase n=1 Tax=Maribacter halichondriae TaxID=2980554 RepID=UPI002358BDED|nr:biotin--[acetyl-CoA-carboxylase] ligase [Maribacter sp. Hal144]
MHVIKLNATDSTNSYLKSLVQSGHIDDLTTVVADQQYMGRGQMGTYWQSETGKNLTFSVLKHFDDFNAIDRFRLNICISLALVAALNELQVPDIAIKWPNDILSGTSKICGILIENTLSGDKIRHSIIGIGLNVNQYTFDTLENVSSLKLLLGRNLNLDELLNQILTHLKKEFQNLESHTESSFWKSYENLLFRKDKPSTFNDNEGSIFMGFIRGVSKNGKLQVTLEDDILKEFDLKEVKLLY